MTAFTSTANAWMYVSQKCSRGKTATIRVIVTHAAFILRRNVIKLLRRCNTRVMTGRTIAAHYIQIMDKRAGEGTKTVVDDVARRTLQVRRHMTNRLAIADITVMAGQAVAGIRARVIKRHRSKIGRCMASGAILVVGIGRNVIRQFTYTNIIIVTLVAATSDTGMIITASGKGTRGVTNTTILTGWHVIERFTARINTMTGCTIV